MRVVLARLVLALALGALGACGSPDSAREHRDKVWEPWVEPTVTAGAELDLDFDRAAGAGDLVPGLRNEGTASVAVSVVTTAGGRLRWARGRDGGGAVRTPAYAPSGTIPGAGIVARPAPVAGGADALSPGRRRFTFGLDFRSDAATAGRAGDDGDNLLQRGRFGGPAQYKLQLDHGVPSCRVQGSAAAVLVKADRKVRPGRWYRLSCTRVGSGVRMSLVDLDTTDRHTWVTRVDAGTVDFTGEPAQPVSIAAKAGTDGTLDTSSLDQFHGEVDRVYVDVG